jgi:hypothetical protein
VNPQYRERSVALAREIHSAFVIPGRGVIWKMREDLSGAYPGYGYGAMDAHDGYVSYRALDEEALAPEIAEMHALIEGDWRTLEIDRRETAAAISACKIIIMALLCSSVACVWCPREPEPRIMVSPSTLISRRN